MYEALENSSMSEAPKNTLREARKRELRLASPRSPRPIKRVPLVVGAGEANVVVCGGTKAAQWQREVRRQRRGGRSGGTKACEVERKKNTKVEKQKNKEKKGRMWNGCCQI
jgi:hypothetical protein